MCLVRLQEEAIQKTEGNKQDPTINIDTLMANKMQEDKRVDTKFKRTMFGQTFQYWTTQMAEKERSVSAFWSVVASPVNTWFC